MVGLIMKDLYNLKRYLKQISLTFGILAIVAFQLKEPAYLIGMVTMVSSMQVITAMSYDDYTKWDKYALTMPILRKDIILSKYILLILLSIGGSLSSGILSVIMAVYWHTEEIKIIAVMCITITLTMLLLFSIVLPLVIKYGVEKARILIFAIVAVPAFLSVTFVKLMQRLNIPKPSKAILMKLYGTLTYTVPVIVLIALYLSYKLSVRIYNKKEL